MKQGPPTYRRRFDSGIIKILAKRLSLTERRIRQLISNGTSSQETARILAEELNADVPTFLRAARPVGRPRRDGYPFKEFILDRDDTDINERLRQASKSVREIVVHFRKGYIKDRDVPIDFNSLSHFKNWAETNLILRDLTDGLPDLWRLFQIWKVRRKADADIFDIEISDAYD